MPPPKSGAMPSLSGLIDSDGDVDMMPSPGPNQENEPLAKAKKPTPAVASKPRGRPPGKTTAAAKPKVKPSQSKGGASKRAPLQEQDNEQQLSDTEDGDDFDEIGDESRPSTRNAAHESEDEDMPKAAAPKAAARRGRPPAKVKQEGKEKPAASRSKLVQKDGEFEYTPTRHNPGKTSKSKKGAYGNDESIVARETSQEGDNTMLSIEEDDVVESVKEKKPQQQHKITSQKAKTTTNHRRAGSTAEPEQGDPSLRRKLGEMTRKFEALESRYRNLKEIGIVEAEANFDRLKKQSEQRTKAANDLIQALRDELEAQKATAMEVHEQTHDHHATQKSLSAAEARVSELTASLNTSRKENQALQAKLARSAPDGGVQRGKMSATKPGVGSNGEVSHALQVAQLKEDLYSDLTGLIIRSVEKTDDSTVYDCIQTGCNGTLHFKLSVATEEGAASFEDTDFFYEPRLDKDRDQDLIEIMPDYLSDEISFSRAHAAKFYSRISDTLTKRLVDP